MILRSLSSRLILKEGNWEGSEKLIQVFALSGLKEWELIWYYKAHTTGDFVYYKHQKQKKGTIFFFFLIFFSCLLNTSTGEEPASKEPRSLATAEVCSRPQHLCVLMQQPQVTHRWCVMFTSAVTQNCSGPKSGSKQELKNQRVISSLSNSLCCPWLELKHSLAKQGVCVAWKFD